MVCRTVRNLAQQGYSLGATNMNVALIKLAMQTPTIVLVPVGIIGGKLQDGLRMCPVLGSLDVSSMPVVGPFVAGVRAAQAAGAAVSALESTTAPFASVGARAEAPIGVTLIGTVREAEKGELVAIENERGSSVGRKQMPLPDWFESAL
ncbi:hypothetical protein GGR53DRAFT_465466 [Hypoxylon sp. FL1150]|nr:hypothetical protein GGR53DRAFT_465466 [Hypoxylon sp. FL1150]